MKRCPICHTEHEDAFPYCLSCNYSFVDEAMEKMMAEENKKREEEKCNY
jgi:hypothetical protein